MSFAGPLDVFILHFNRPDLLATTLESVRRAAMADVSSERVDVWVLDNGSEAAHRKAAQDAVSGLAQDARLPVHWTESTENQGFARGMNTLWRQARPKGWVLFLNADAEIAPDFISGVRAHLPSPTSKCFASPIIEENGRRYSGGRFELWRAIARMAPAERPGPDFASGSALLIPAPMLPASGPWNEAFFFYGEDVELSVRLRRLGWELTLLPFLVKHVGRGSVDGDRAIELHFNGRSTLVRQLPVSQLRRALIRAVVTVELGLRSLGWMVSGRGARARAAWRGWFRA